MACFLSLRARFYFEEYNAAFILKGAIYVKISKIDIRHLDIAASRHFRARSGNSPINRDYEEPAKSGLGLHPSCSSPLNAHLPSRTPRALRSSQAWWMATYAVNQIKRIERAITDLSFPERSPLKFKRMNSFYFEARIDRINSRKEAEKRRDFGKRMSAD